MVYWLLKMLSSDAPRREVAEAYSGTYVEASEQLRTKLDGFFSNQIWRIPTLQV
jgi:hypothetical protein